MTIANKRCQSWAGYFPTAQASQSSDNNPVRFCCGDSESVSGLTLPWRCAEVVDGTKARPGGISNEVMVISAACLSTHSDLRRDRARTHTQCTRDRHSLDGASAPMSAWIGFRLFNRAAERGNRDFDLWQLRIAESRLRMRR